MKLRAVHVVATLILSLGCRTVRRPLDATRVFREMPVHVAGQPDADRWFATIYALQTLLGADERLRDEFVARLAALLELSPDADLDAVAHALHTHANAEGWALQVADETAPDALEAAVARWALALRTQDPEPTTTHALLGMPVAESATVRCAPQTNALCTAVGRAVQDELWQSLVRRQVFEALAGSETLREGLRARGVRLRSGAPAALALEFDAAQEFLVGLETRAAAMALSRSQRARWIRSVTVEPPVVVEDDDGVGADAGTDASAEGRR